MAVIKDVAQLAGVSIGTVSKYFNHPEQLRPATRERVGRVVEALGYRPNPIARSMRTGKTQIVAVLAPEIANPFYAEGFSSLSAQMVAAGYLPLLITTDGNPLVEDAKELSLLIAHTDAIVLYLLDAELNDRLLARLQAIKPTLLVTQRPHAKAASSVVIEEEEGMAELAQHLLSIGRRRIAFVGGPEKDSMTDTKYDGFLRALGASGIAPLRPLRCASFTPRAGFEAARAILEQGHLGNIRPDAVCCANDALAMGVLKYMRARGIRVPEDIAVTGYDNLALSLITDPALTTVRLPLDEVAAVAVEFMRAGSDGFGARRLGTSLCIRTSSEPGSAGDPYLD